MEQQPVMKVLAKQMMLKVPNLLWIKAFFGKCFSLEFFDLDLCEHLDR